MASTIKPLSAAVALTTDSTVGNATAVYIYNNSGGAVTIARNANSVLVGNFILPSGSYIVVEKKQTETLNSTASVSATRVGVTN